MDKTCLIEDAPIKSEIRVEMSSDESRVYRRALAFFWIITIAFFGSSVAQCMRQNKNNQLEEYIVEEDSFKNIVLSDPWAFLSLVNYLSAAITLLVLRSRLLTSQNEEKAMSKSLKAFMIFSILACWMFILSYIILGFMTCYIEVPPPNLAPISSIMITGAFMFFIIGIFAAIDHKPSDTISYPAVHSV